MILSKCGTHISHVQNILFISSECPFHTRGCGNNISSIHHYSIFMTTMVNMLTKSKFQKIKKICNHMPSQLISFYLLISLEGMSTFNSESGTSNRNFFFVLFPFSISLLPSHCFCQAEPSFLQHFLSVSSVI